MNKQRNTINIGQGSIRDLNEHTAYLQGIPEGDELCERCGGIGYFATMSGNPIPCYCIIKNEQ